VVSVADEVLHCEDNYARLSYNWQTLPFIPLLCTNLMEQQTTHNKTVLQYTNR